MTEDIYTGGVCGMGRGPMAYDRGLKHLNQFEVASDIMNMLLIHFMFCLKVGQWYLDNLDKVSLKKLFPTMNI